MQYFCKRQGLFFPLYSTDTYRYSCKSAVESAILQHRFESKYIKVVTTDLCGSFSFCIYNFEFR